MRAPTRRRSLVREIGVPPGVDLAAVARRVSYVGSPEHKDTPSFAGQPKPRADASICDANLAGKQIEITKWLKNAIQEGRVSAYWEGEFPRYVWHKVAEVVYQARLVNRELGQYKGFPLNDDEWPHGI